MREKTYQQINADAVDYYYLKNLAIELGLLYSGKPSTRLVIRHLIDFYQKGTRKEEGVEIPEEALYPSGTYLEHVKSGKVYRVVCGPTSGLRLEGTNSPAYLYKGEDSRIAWVRSQEEMEDGRFKPYTPPPLYYKGQEQPPTNNNETATERDPLQEGG